MENEGETQWIRNGMKIWFPCNHLVVSKMPHYTAFVVDILQVVTSYNHNLDQYSNENTPLAKPKPIVLCKWPIKAI